MEKGCSWCDTADWPFTAHYMVSNQSAASVTAVYLYTELETAERRQLGQNLKHWNTPAHCAATRGPNQHPALIDTDIYKL